MVPTKPVFFFFFFFFLPFGNREAEAEESANDRVYIVLYPQLLMEKTSRITHYSEFHAMRIDFNRYRNTTSDVSSQGMLSPQICFQTCNRCFSVFGPT